MKVLLNVYGGNPSDPFFQLLGLILMAVMVVLIVKQKKRKSKELACEETTDGKERIYTEKDVLGFDKTSRNYNEFNYKPADKSKFKFIMIVVIFLIGLFLMAANMPRKHGAYKGSVGSGFIHDSEVPYKYDWRGQIDVFQRETGLSSKYDSITSKLVIE